MSILDLKKGIYFAHQPLKALNNFLLLGGGEYGSKDPKAKGDKEPECPMFRHVL